MSLSCLLLFLLSLATLLWDLSPNKLRESLCHWSCLEESNLYPWLLGTISAFSKSLRLLLWFSHCRPTQVVLLKGLIQSSMLLELGNPAGVCMASPSSCHFPLKTKIAASKYICLPTRRRRGLSLLFPRHLKWCLAPSPKYIMFLH